jgi:hypothetical protein
MLWSTTWWRTRHGRHRRITLRRARFGWRECNHWCQRRWTTCHCNLWRSRSSSAAIRYLDRPQIISSTWFRRRSWLISDRFWELLAVIRVRAVIIVPSISQRNLETEIFTTRLNFEHPPPANCYWTPTPTCEPKPNRLAQTSSEKRRIDGY